MTTHAQPDTSTTGRHITALDGLRGTAVLMVVVCHSFGGYWPQRMWQSRVLAAGWVGVDLFFVLSGFLLTGILYDTLNGTHYFRNFYVRRALRIFPLYYGYLLLVAGLCLLLHIQLLPRLWAFVAYVQNLTPVSWDITLHRPLRSFDNFVFHLWSLAVEEHFYFLWPALVYLLRTRRRIASGALVLAVASVCVRTYIVVLRPGDTHAAIAYLWTPTRLDGLFMGALLAIAVRSPGRQRWFAAAPWVCFITFAGILAYTLRYGLDPLFDPWVKSIGFTILAVFFASLLASTLRSGSWSGAVFSTPLLRFFGRYSYGIYVFAVLVGFFMDLRGHQFLLAVTHSHTLTNLLNAALDFPIAVGLAYLSFHLFESRFLALKRHFQDDSRTPKLRRQLSENVRPYAA